MNRTNLTALESYIRSLTGCTHKEAKERVDAVLTGITTCITTSDRFELRGVGVFSVKTMKARKCRNPLTGAAMEKAAFQKVSFKPASKLTERVNLP